VRCSARSGSAAAGRRTVSRNRRSRSEEFEARVREGRRPGAVHPEGKSVFTILSLDDDRALIESTSEAPGRYPFSIRVTYLVPAP
jgi:hypothetical protein